ncbi:MerR-like DNA binding protein [Haloactinospora alba]|uniref:MerR-like DNA binding protein n=1 Tax=Haloactinospora alba TaxID=405555 RepID=A0A543NF50_9ACTN|nr:MerR family transcriptional regulator [Haloactinospora alba]TQN30437.1 MerR-like DNA binding protein [Haloactinospora alba]
MSDRERSPSTPAHRPSRNDSEERIPISSAAERLDTSARMLRYRENLGLLPVTKEQPTGRGHRHRRFSEADLRTVAAGLELERAYDITPAALAFALRMLAEPTTLARVRAYGERLGRLAPPPARAMDFEKQKALRLMRQREQDQ